MRRSNTSIASATLICLILTGCAHHHSSRPAENLQKAESPSEVAPASQPSAADADRDVLNVVWNDLLTERETPLAARHAPPRELLLFPGPSPYPRTAEQVLMRHDKKQWDALTPAQLAAAREAAGSLIARHQRGDALPATWNDPRIKIHSSPPEPQPKTRHPLADRPIHANPPGFAADARTAIVSLSLPWSIHHADATYLLVKEGTAWRIVLRQFVYYM
jgi:hypothetical protein